MPRQDAGGLNRSRQALAYRDNPGTTPGQPQDDRDRDHDHDRDHDR